MKRKDRIYACNLLCAILTRTNFSGGLKEKEEKLQTINEEHRSSEWQLNRIKLKTVHCSHAQ